MTEELVKLNQRDLKTIEAEVQLLAGDPPSLQSLRDEGYRENTMFVRLLDWIADAGRVVTLLIAETIQSGAALIIAVLFALLEYFRVKHGAVALGQESSQAALIAVAVVAANVVHPIYSLRHMRGQEREVTRQTGRGYLESFWRRLTGRPQVETVDMYHNPTLHLAAAVITWTTVVLAVYDILGPLLESVFTGTLAQPPAIAALELIMGLGLSIAGVFFLQSAAHEIGVRTVTDQPHRLADLLAERREQHAQAVAELREDVRNRYMQTKLAERERRAMQKAAEAQAPMQAPMLERFQDDGDETQEYEPVPLAVNGR